MLEIDKTNLSKYKHIYRIYSNGYELHMEKFPIIYINKQFVYYRRPEETFLRDISMSNINNNYSQNTTFDCFYNKYFMSNDKNEINEIFEMLKVQSEHYFTKQKRLKNESYLDKAKREYEEALKKYELMLKIKEKYTGEKNE